MVSRGATAGIAGGKPAAGPERSPEEDAEQTGDARWAETLGVKVTEPSRKGSGWEGLDGGLGAKGWAQTAGNSGAFWENLRDMLGGDLKASAWSSGRL